MNIRTMVIAVVAFGLGALIGTFGYIWLVGGDGTASEPISAPTLDVNALPTLNPTESFALQTQVAQLSTQVAEAIVVAEPTEAATVEEVSSVTSRSLYRIDSSASEVAFTLQEDLRGSRVEVVGTTNEVAGDIIIDFANPAASQIGTIRINGRTLATDNEFRNRALRSEILQTSRDEYEFIEFTPSALNGLPESIEVGQTYTIEIIGNLTLIGQPREVTFTAEVTATSETQLTGSATATVLYSDWGISIPNAPGVANITDEVLLTLNFVANQVEG